jgi:hypothetical protein
MTTRELRPMGIGDILDTTFRLYRERFLTFLLIALVVYVPYALLLTLFQPFQTASAPTIHQQALQYHAHVMQTSPVTESNLMGTVLGGLGNLIFVIVLLPLCGAALVHNISASYLGETLTAGQSYARAAPRLLGLLGTQFLATLVIMVGFILLVVPGIIFSLWFLLIAPVVILECTAGPSALGRSRELMRGNISKGFALGLCVGILSFIIAWALSMLTTLVPLPHPAIGVFFHAVLQALILPIQTAPWILLYYDLRIRKEAFDLQKLAEALSPVAVK